MQVALLLSYDGTDFRGFQRQVPKYEPTIQGSIERAIARLSRGQLVTISGAGRTDAGVHASGQVVTFPIPVDSHLTAADWQRGLNAVLPAAIAVQDACLVADTVSARFSAQSRTYIYKVLLDQVRDPLRERFMWRVPQQLDLSAISACCELLRGEHDFAAFGHSPANRQGRPRHPTVRHLLQATIHQNADLVQFEFMANAFLTGMVRHMVGTLISVGKGRLTTQEFKAILAACQSGHPGATAPPRGLCLTHVDYPPGTIAWAS